MFGEGLPTSPSNLTARSPDGGPETFGRAWWHGQETVPQRYFQHSARNEPRERKAASGQEETPMIRKCAWCGQTLGSVPPLEDFTITHSVCQACGTELLQELDRHAKAGQDDDERPQPVYVRRDE